MSTARPIRDLIRPEYEAPVQPISEHNERRRYHRYNGHDLPGILQIDKLDVPIACRNLSYGGIQVQTTVAVHLLTGTRVSITLERYGGAFTGDYSVRHVTAMDDGTVLHLAT